MRTIVRVSLRRAERRLTARNTLRTARRLRDTTVEVKSSCMESDAIVLFAGARPRRNGGADSMRSERSAPAVSGALFLNSWELRKKLPRFLRFGALAHFPGRSRPRRTQEDSRLRRWRWRENRRARQPS